MRPRTLDTFNAKMDIADAKNSPNQYTIESLNGDALREIGDSSTVDDLFYFVQTLVQDLISRGVIR